MSTKPNVENPLSAREMEVAELLVTGASNAEIARELVISPQTVKVHVRNLYDKLDVSSRAEATLLLLQKGWLNLPELEINGSMAAGPESVTPQFPEPNFLSDRPARPRLWQKIYLVGAALFCLFLLWVPSRLNRPQDSQAEMLTDTVATKMGQPDVEIFSRWEFRVPMPLARSRLAVASQGERIYVLGGENQDGQPTTNANVYNININEWQPISPLAIPLSNAASTILQNRLYIAGGSTVHESLIQEDTEGNTTQSINQKSISDRLWAYNMETTLWSEETVGLPNPLTGAALVTAEEAIYLIGGWDGYTMRNEIWRLVPSQSDSENEEQRTRWELVTRLKEARAFLGATEVAGKIYVVGGYDGQKELGVANVYILAEDSWQDLPNMAFPRGGLSLVADELAVFALGGGWTSPLNNHERFDLVSERWTNFPSPVQGSWRHFAAASTQQEGHLHLIGGWGGDYMDLHLRYQSSFRSLLPVINNDR